MTPQQVLDHYGSQAEIARVLGCRQSSVFEWFDKGEVPDGRQYQIEIATGGVLKADKPANRNPADEPADSPGAKKASAPHAAPAHRAIDHREPRQDRHADKPSHRSGH